MQYGADGTLICIDGMGPCRLFIDGSNLGTD